MKQEEHREGFYRDKYGNWRPERRTGGDRRAQKAGPSGAHERRKFYRRKADRELLLKDHQTMIDEALEDFAEQHDGHL